jgi:flotillin
VLPVLRELLQFAGTDPQKLVNALAERLSVPAQRDSQ